MALSKSAIYSRQLMTSTSVTKRWKVTATAPAAVGAEEEWNAAKPYDQIPGARSLPILGTMWAAIGAWNLYSLIKSHIYIIISLNMHNCNNNQVQEWMSLAFIFCKTSTTKNTVLFGVTSFQDYLQWWPLLGLRILKSSLLCGKR